MIQFFNIISQSRFLENTNPNAIIITQTCSAVREGERGMFENIFSDRIIVILVTLAAASRPSS